MLRKTTTATQFAKTLIELQHPTLDKSYIEPEDVNPLLLLDGEKALLNDNTIQKQLHLYALYYSILLKVFIFLGVLF